MKVTRRALRRRAVSVWTTRSTGGTNRCAFTIAKASLCRNIRNSLVGRARLLPSRLMHEDRLGRSLALLNSVESNLQDFLLLLLDQLIHLGLVLLGQFLDLLFAFLGIVLIDNAALLLGRDDLVRVAAGVADRDLGGFRESLALSHE